MELGSGNLHYRPLAHSPGQYRHCVFTLEKPRSWSLLQRDRLFSSYEDPEARYHDRPSVKVEPVSGFDLGKLHLIELPTPDETEDNVVLLWEPQPMVEVVSHFGFTIVFIGYVIQSRPVFSPSEPPAPATLCKSRVRC